MDVVQKLQADAHTADQLHERSRGLLVDAVRTGVAAGLSQREIAAAIGRSQPEVSRLLRFQGHTELARRLVRRRKEILELASAHGVKNVRVFGSVARGTDTTDSDIDLLVDVSAGTGLFTLARLEQALGALLGTSVDVTPAAGLRAHLAEHVLRDSVPL